MSKQNDTIYALSTPTGKSALAVIRVSGENVKKIITKLSNIKKIESNKTKVVFLQYDEEILDQALISYFKKPKSFTGEEMLEISCHGSTAIIKKISTVLELLGVRLAEPGEFTKRALINNKIDLVKTESIADLVNAETEKQRSLAISNLSGKLSSFTKKIHEELGLILANIEALIDFSDEDLPKNIYKRIKEQNKNIINKIKKELKASEISKQIRAGFTVSIVGKPNTGKSSFINYISNKEVSIVTEIPGTTTDTITSALEIFGYKFTFIDTAGIRKHKNKIEEMGIKKTKETMKNSDINLVFLEKKEINTYKKLHNKIFIRSKLDLRREKNQEKGIINISSKTGSGVTVLLKKITKNLVKNMKNEPVFSRERHIKIMENVLETLCSVNFDEDLDVLAFKYRLALNQSLEINQKFDIENILDIIFKDFCIGK